MGHAGDGNIHPNIPIDLRDADQAEKFAKAKLPTDTFLNITIPLVKKYDDFFCYSSILIYDE